MPFSKLSGSGAGVGATSLVYRYTVAGADKASIDTGVDTPDAGSNDWTSGDLLEVWFYGRTDEAATIVIAAMTFNNDTSAIYERVYITMTNATVAGANELTNSAVRLNCAGASAAASVFSMSRITIPNYTGTTGFKVLDFTDGIPDTSAASTRVIYGSGGYRSASAITRLAITPETALKKFKVGSQLLIYKRLRS